MKKIRLKGMDGSRVKSMAEKVGGPFPAISSLSNAHHISKFFRASGL